MPALVSVESRQRRQLFISLQYPVLPRALEAGLILAGRWLRHPGADRLSVGSSLLVIHPRLVSDEMADFIVQGFLLGRRQGLWAQARFLKMAQDIERPVPAPGQETEQGLEPMPGLLGALPAKGPGQVVRVFFYVEGMHPLLGVLETVVSQTLYPDGAVGDDEHLLGVEQSAQDGFHAHLLGEGGQTLAGGNAAPLGDDPPSGLGLAALVEAEDGVGNNPVPPLRLLALAA